MGAVLASAKTHVDELKFSEAEVELRVVLETGKERDSITDEARFVRAELFVQQNKFDDAVECLTALLKLPELSGAIREKAMIRLGHVYCARNDKENSAKVFAQFRREYPESGYLPLADCSAVGR